MRRLIVSLIFIAQAALAQTEIAVSTPRYGAAPGDQMTPKVATNGSDFLVAWNDYRGSGAVYAQRITRDGTVLDGTGIRVGSGMLLGVFRTGGAYTLILINGNSTFAARIDDDGQVIEPPHVVVTGTLGGAAASNGTRIILADEDGLTVLDERGNFIEHNVTAPPEAYWVDVGSNGSTFLLVTATYANAHNAVSFTALDANGHRISTTQRDEAAGGDGIIAPDGNDYLVIYQRGGGDSVAVNVDRVGIVKSETVLPANSLSFAAGALQWSGSSYLLVTFSYTISQMAIATISRDGARLGLTHPLGPTTPGAIDVPSIAWNGTEALIAWVAGQQMDPNGWEILGAFANADGSALADPMTIPRSGNPQKSPAIATGGVNDLVVWSESSDVYAARLMRGGASLDAGGILVAHGAWQARVVFDGAAYLVVWNNANGVHGQRIDAATGALLGDSRTLYAACATDFDLGRDDAGALLVVNDCSNRLFAQRVGVAGAVGGPVPISPSGMPSGSPRMAWNGSEWLVVWEKLIEMPWLGPVPIYRGNVYAERLSSALVFEDPQPIAIALSPDPNWNTDERQPIVATDGRDFLVAWTRGWPDADGHGMGIRIRPVGADGSVGAPAQLVEGEATAHSVVWDGAHYAIAYDVARDDHSHEIDLTHGTDRIVISAGPEQRDVALTMSGHILRAAYARVAPEPLYGGVFRVFVRDFAGRRRAAGR